MRALGQAAIRVGARRSRSGVCEPCFLLGHAELARGEIPAALKLLHEAKAGAEKHSVKTGLQPASCFALAEAHAKLGQLDAANDAINEARRCVPADYLFMQTNLAVASGRALAAGGYLTDAISKVRAAGEDARKPINERMNWPACK